MFYENIFYESNFQQKQMEQEDIQKQKNIAEYKDMVCGNIRSYNDSVQSRDYNLAISTTEQIIENSLKMVGINEGNLREDLETSHDLVSLKKLNNDIFKKFSNNSMRRAEKYYYRKYPNRHARTTREEAVKAGKLAVEVADVAFEKVGVQGYDLDREIGRIKEEKVKSFNDYGIWNRLDI